MTWENTLPLLIILSALVPGLITFGLREKQRKLRSLLNLGGAALTLGFVLILLLGVYQNEVYETTLPLLPTMHLVLHADALSLLFVSLSASLWLVTTIYAIGYLAHSKNLGRFFGFFSLCVSATMGIALAGNLVTFLIFYEFLTLTTYPLVVHQGTPAAMRAGRTYLIYTVIGGALLLAGIVWLKVLAGPLDFTTTGILADLPQLSRTQLKIIFYLLIAGLGVKAALVPFHGWLPVAMAAPAPVSALLHAVAVVKAGAFGVVRVVYDVYGIEFARDLGLTTAIAIVASTTIVYGSIRALTQDGLKKRLAYSTVSQVSYIVLGTAIAGPLATIGGIVHLVNQGLMKITLFFCAGNFAETLGVNKVSEMDGIGRRMPWTMAAFTVTALGMIGIPPVAGFVSKWYLGVGAIEAEAYWAIVVLAVSSLLNAAYFLPIIYAGWFKSPPTTWPQEQKVGAAETPWTLLAPPLITSLLALFVGIFANWIGSPLSWVKIIAAREYGLSPISLPELSFLQVPGIWVAILLPLLLAVGLGIRRARSPVLKIVPWSALPALIVTFISHPGVNILPEVFFGSITEWSATTRVLMLLSATLWLAAGLYSRDYLKEDTKQIRFAVAYLLAMGGNFGLIFSQDAFGFLTFFTLMSLAAYLWVVHSGTETANQAGKTYIQWVILGEILLFTAFVWLTFTDLNSLPRTLAGVSQGSWIIGLFVLGFGIKAGLMPFHVWLPLAHPVAPVPASAVLSGLMVKAGFIGWIRFLPLTGENLYGASEVWGQALILLGLGGAFLAVMVGFFQNNPKTVLAYSTVSQMGIIAAGVGAWLVEPGLEPVLLPALLLYVFNHGFAKGALFLSVGLVPRLLKPGPQRIFLWVAIAIPALSLVGFPLTSGALAKSALKTSLEEFSLFATLLPITAIGTSLLMLRFLKLLVPKAESSAPNHPVSGMMLFSFALLLPPLLGLSYLLPQARDFIPETLKLKAFWVGLWPLGLAAILYLAFRQIHSKIPTPPSGDLVVIYDKLGRCCYHIGAKTGKLAASTFQLLKDGTMRRFNLLVTKDNRLRISLHHASMTWMTPGLIFTGILAVLLAALLIK